MAKQLIRMSWAEVQAEMSIAGSPEKITKMGKDVFQLIGASIDTTNRAELINVEFMLKYIIAQIKREQREYDERH